MSDEVKKVIFDFVMRAVLKEILKAAPFFALPVVNTIFTWVFNWAAAKAYVHFKRSIDFFQIDFETEQERAQFQNELAKFNQALQTGDANAKDNARKKLEQALADLIRIDRH